VKNKIAFTVLRVSLGAVFLIFGIGKFQNDVWAQTVRNMDVFQSLPWNIDLTVLMIGVSETAIGAALVLGVFTRVFAAAAALELTSILFLLQFQETRDFGLLGAVVYMALVKQESFGLPQLWRRPRE